MPESIGLADGSYENKEELIVSSTVNIKKNMHNKCHSYKCYEQYFQLYYFMNLVFLPKILNAKVCS